MTCSPGKVWIPLVFSGVLFLVTSCTSNWEKADSFQGINHRLCGFQVVLILGHLCMVKAISPHFLGGESGRVEKQWRPCYLHWWKAHHAEILMLQDAGFFRKCLLALPLESVLEMHNEALVFIGPVNCSFAICPSVLCFSRICWPPSSLVKLSLGIFL